MCNSSSICNGKQTTISCALLFWQRETVITTLTHWNKLWTIASVSTLQCENNESYILTWLTAQLTTIQWWRKYQWIICILFFVSKLPVSFAEMLTGGHSACYVVPLTTVLQNWFHQQTVQYPLLSLLNQIPYTFSSEENIHCYLLKNELGQWKCFAPALYYFGARLNEIFTCHKFNVFLWVCLCKFVNFHSLVDFIGIYTQNLKMIFLPFCFLEGWLCWTSIHTEAEAHLALNQTSILDFQLFYNQYFLLFL